MVMMDGHYSEDHLQQLWHRIDTLHLSYLEIEESPEKLDTRNKLENCIQDFLCISTPDQKFYNQETMEVLYKSASSKPDFSGYKAATGFNTIQLYAGNILSQPWRREYHQIRLYSGFYKHHIEANLVEAESLFKAMGYKYIGNGILLLEAPVCPDKATAVSRDCLVAYVECQILKTIWEELSPSFEVTWLDVLEFRKKYICSPAQTIKTLKYQFNKRKYQELTRNGYIEHDTNFSHSQPKPIAQNYYSPVNYNHPPYEHANSLPNNHKYPYDINGCCPSLMHPTVTSNPYTYPVPGTLIPEVIPDQYGRYCCPDTYVMPKQCPVHNYNPYHGPPTDLIKFSSQNDLMDNINYPKPIKENAANRPGIVNDIYSRKLSEILQTDSSDNCEKRSQFEDWDYVYRNLASQGYSKDLGERGNILNSVSKQVQSQQLNNDLYVNHDISEIDGGLPGNFTVYNKEIKNPRTQKAVEKPNEESHYKSIIGKKNQSKAVTVNSNTNKSSQPKKNINEDLASTSKTIVNCDATKGKEIKVTNLIKTSENKGENKWQCKTCTFLNEDTNDICEMCSKSRSVVIQPIEIGGTQCSFCTLVNPKDSKTCTACNNSLKNSPTYI